MRAYHFRLATVARIRALEERLARDRFMVALRDLRRAREAEGAAEAALMALEPPAGVITMATMHWIGDQAERLSESVRVCHDVVLAALLASVEAGRAWNVATKRSGVLERLDEQGLARWRDEALRHDAAELDDLTNARHGLMVVGR